MLSSAPLRDSEVGPGDSASNIGTEDTNVAQKRINVPRGKKAAKVENEHLHYQRSLAQSSRCMVDVAKDKLKLMARDIKLKEDHLKIATINVKTDGLTDLAKNLLEMQQMKLYLEMKRDTETLLQERFSILSGISETRLMSRVFS